MKEHIEKKHIFEFKEALEKLGTHAVKAGAGIATILTEKQEVETLVFGGSNEIDVLIMTLIKYASDKEQMNLFEKILSMQTRLMQVHLSMYEEYIDSLKKRNDQGEFDL